MEYLDIEQVEEGMILGKDIVTPAGDVLLGEGTELSSGTIQSLKKRGITKVAITTEEDSQSFTEEEISRAKEELKGKFAERFRNPPAEGMMEQLLDIVLSMKAIEYLRGNHGTG